MKNTLVYYAAIIIPLLTITTLAAAGYIGSGWFVVFLFCYVLVYRTITDYMRLVSKNIIGKKDFWRILIPGSRIKYFRQLYF